MKNGATPRMGYAERTATLQDRMKKEGLSAIVIYSDEYRPGNARYLTGFQTINVIEESAQVVWLPIKGAAVVFTGTLNTFAARRTSAISDVRRIDTLAEDLTTLVTRLPSKTGKIGIVGLNILPVALWEVISKALEGFDTADCSEMLSAERAIKSSSELEAMKRAAEIGDVAIRSTLAMLRPGNSEREACGIGEYVTRLCGGDIGSAYLAVSGRNIEFPAWRPSDETLNSERVLMLDYAPAYLGYASDVAATVALPGASNEQREVVNFAWSVSADAMSWMSPGTVAKDIFDKLAERVADAGYGDYFAPYTVGLRAIGHGVGLDVVEPPDFGPRSEYVLSAGMVLALKFDLHGFDWGGVRVEHVVAITEGGAQPLNCPLSDLCPARDRCQFYRPGGEALSLEPGSEPKKVPFAFGSEW